MFSKKIKTFNLLLIALPLLSSCAWGPAIDLSPEYKPNHFVLPDDWKGQAPFVVAQPADDKIRKDWWKIFNDPLLDKLHVQLEKENPELQAAAERFLQSRYEMMKIRTGYLPKVGIGGSSTQNRRSEHSLFMSDFDPIQDKSVLLNAGASWAPDFWSKIRNATKAQVFKAQEQAARYGGVKLLLHAELLDQYFTLRALDAQNAIFKQSIEYYQTSLSIVNDQYSGKVASLLDVSRAKYQLANTQARQLDVEANRQVVEHAIAILLNESPTTFKIAPVEHLPEVDYKVPDIIPSVLLERRPDIAALERRMAQANKMIGIARAAFFPSINIFGGSGFETNGVNLFSAGNKLWSYGASVDIPIFSAGFRRAQLKQSWSMYREMMNDYRAGVLNAFREVENGLSKTNLLRQELQMQAKVVEAAFLSQDLSMKLFKGGLASSLDLIYAQVNTLEARLREVEIKRDLFLSSVGLIKALGGGWESKDLPKVDDIQPMGTFQYIGLDKPDPAGGIDRSYPEKHQNLIKNAGVHVVAPKAPDSEENSATENSNEDSTAEEESD